MNEDYSINDKFFSQEPEKPQNKYWLHLLLFFITLISTTLAGAEWMTGRSFFYGTKLLGFSNFWAGLYFSVPFLGILTAHEFGHYFTAKYYKINVSLPFYIPVWLGFLPTLSIGTMGAFIKIRESLKSTKEIFDVGIAGPLAGFVVALGVLWYGFTHLPPPEYIFEIHPEYKQFGFRYADHVYKNTFGALGLGTNLVFEFFKRYVAEDPKLIPNMYEMAHYPYLFAGYLALFFTALNLIPIGQLDGGHILYGLIGFKKHKAISLILFIAFIFYAGIGSFTHSEVTIDTIWYVLAYIGFLYFVFQKSFKNKITPITIALSIFTAQLLVTYLFPTVQGYSGWLVFGFVLGNFLGIYHPPTKHEHPLDLKRKILGWLALLIFILCFSPQPFVL
ncbi:MAG: site-2 protease family protein [Cytophagales bacterium]|nr:MAG: site-2 protease family protein [Cytophagales bacterium]